MAFNGFDFWEGSGLEIIAVTEILNHSGNIHYQSRYPFSLFFNLKL
jgi:hypothetical protein